ncbi:unnamed protein product [Ranitomeya imitator]|uniref:G-protein coupled receptors family 1 profile domain-containing protein n=1 Tax=Ranitomeya imitator TaxID=111125 RepID=A0ABN9L984_9NEOB|nr:unnamed protein product [Ranitomeya imitator]
MRQPVATCTTMLFHDDSMGRPVNEVVVMAFDRYTARCHPLRYRSHVIAHFFCDVPPMMTIACANTYMVKMYQLVVSIVATVFPTILIICSYIKILNSIFLLRSAESRHKAFVTCGSHLVSVIIFFGAAMFVHLRLDNPFSPYEDRMLALSYCVIIQTINPLIYSLKNKEMKNAIRKLNLRMTLH